MRLAFVLQLGPETHAADRHFEGRIEEVDTGRELRFRSTDELLSFLSDCSRARRPPRLPTRDSGDLHHGNQEGLTVTANEMGAPPSDEIEIRQLLERWAAAVQSCDEEGVLRDHSDDIVMFDVPPPETGVRGIQAYRDTWPPFFKWLRHGGMFEIDSLEVAAGTDVAFAHALLRCSTVETLQKQPDKRLRLTVGLQKTDGRWTVAHEHHSFTQQ